MDFNNTFNNNNQFMNFNFEYNNINNNNAFCINNSNNINCMNNMNLMNNNMNNMNLMNNNMNNMNLMNNSINNGNNMNFMNNMNCLNCMNNLNNWNNMNEVNNINQTSYNHINVTFINCNSGLKVVIVSSLDEKINDLIDKYLKKVGLPKEMINEKLVFLLGAEKLDYNNLTLAEIGIGTPKKSTITVIDQSNIIGAGTPPYKKVINIKFLKLPNSSIYKNNNKDIIGILKLCLLKEVSQNLSEYQLDKLPEIYCYLMKMLQKGYLQILHNIEQNIIYVLDKITGSNIINFSNYVDEIIDLNQLNKILSLLNKEDLKEMLDIKNRLSKYNEYLKIT